MSYRQWHFNLCNEFYRLKWTLRFGRGSTITQEEHCRREIVCLGMPGECQPSTWPCSPGSVEVSVALTTTLHAHHRGEWPQHKHHFFKHSCPYITLDTLHRLALSSWRFTRTTTCLSYGGERQVPTILPGKQIFVLTSWVIHIHTHPVHILICKGLTSQVLSLLKPLENLIIRALCGKLSAVHSAQLYS